MITTKLKQFCSRHGIYAGKSLPSSRFESTLRLLSASSRFSVSVLDSYTESTLDSYILYTVTAIMEEIEQGIQLPRKQRKPLTAMAPASRT